MILPAPRLSWPRIFLHRSDHWFSHHTAQAWHKQALRDEEIQQTEKNLAARITTFKWVSWWNTTRIHENLGYQTPQ
ncbi:transposase [Mobiluncus mulieris]|uniref:Transposase n=1 Tax=Mobiluncus mulieris TaxID=2052 RepID=A0A7Y0YHT7_9ACTO|nr:transposase [Mobiluncus mulieris]NMW62201.1 transposase [Mobiluncus mulieris]NMX03420.1 transposase [Mobiluncus mulieris]